MYSVLEAIDQLSFQFTKPLWGEEMEKLLHRHKPYRGCVLRGAFLNVLLKGGLERQREREQ